MFKGKNMEELLKTAEKGRVFFPIAMAGPMGETLVDRMHREIEIMTRRSLGSVGISWGHLGLQMSCLLL